MRSLLFPVHQLLFRSRKMSNLRHKRLAQRRRRRVPLINDNRSVRLSKRSRRMSRYDTFGVRVTAWASWRNGVERVLWEAALGFQAVTRHMLPL